MRITALLALFLVACSGGGGDPVVFVEQEPNDDANNANWVGEFTAGDTVLVQGESDPSFDYYEVYPDPWQADYLWRIRCRAMDGNRVNLHIGPGYGFTAGRDWEMLEIGPTGPVVFLVNSSHHFGRYEVEVTAVE